MKKFLSLLLAILTLIGIVSVAAVPASAVNTEAFGRLSETRYATAFALSSSGKTIPYTTSELKHRGSVTNGKNNNAYIDNAKDDIRVISVGTTGGNRWAYVSYPIGSKRAYAYIRLSDIISNASGNIKGVATGRIYCAHRRGAAVSTRYYADKGDTVYVVGFYGNDQYQILYPSGNKWRIAFCRKSDFHSNCTTSTYMDVTSLFAGKKITIKSVQNGKFFSADANYSDVPGVCNRAKADTWETFTVSSLTSNGWVGFKASSNGKYLSARSDINGTPIKATASKLQSWECFRIYKKGNDYYIKAQVNSKWLCVRVDRSNAAVTASASKPSFWERFSINVISVQNNSDKNKSGLHNPVPAGCYFTKQTLDVGKKWTGYHDININVSTSTPVYAIAKGKVTYKQSYAVIGGSKYLISYGNQVEFTSDDGVYKVIYAHLDRFNGVNQIIPTSRTKKLSNSDAKGKGYATGSDICGKAGMSVNAGQVLGYIGTTGNSTGIHLHIEVYKNGVRVDPTTVFKGLTR